MHHSSTILCPIACWVGTWKFLLHIVVSCGRHPTTPLFGPGRQISYCYAWVDGISVECITRVMRGWLNNQDRLRQDFQDLGTQCNSGWRTVDRLPGEPSGWPGMLERPWHPAESFTQAQRDGRIFSRPKAYLHSHKSLWALAWLDNAATLDRWC